MTIYYKEGMYKNDSKLYERQWLYQHQGKGLSLKTPSQNFISSRYNVGAYLVLPSSDTEKIFNTRNLYGKTDMYFEQNVLNLDNWCLKIIY